MKYNIFDIANWFLSKESMPQKKLQKLCYYAKAWSLVLLKDIELDFIRPLIVDGFSLQFGSQKNFANFDKVNIYLI